MEEELNSFFYCSSIASNSNLQKKFLRKLNCEDFPFLNAQPYSCAANYKVDQNILNFLVSIYIGISFKKVHLVHARTNSSFAGARCHPFYKIVRYI